MSPIQGYVQLRRGRLHYSGQMKVLENARIGGLANTRGLAEPVARTVGGVKKTGSVR
jgi:hypothetical protein